MSVQSFNAICPSAQYTQNRQAAHNGIQCCGSQMKIDQKQITPMWQFYELEGQSSGIKKLVVHYIKEDKYYEEHANTSHKVEIYLENGKSLRIEYRWFQKLHDLIALIKSVSHDKITFINHIVTDTGIQRYSPENGYLHFQQYDSKDANPDIVQKLLSRAFQCNVALGINERYFDFVTSRKENIT